MSKEYMSEIEWIDIFADNLRDILKEQKMTQEELAKCSGIDKSLISRYVNKKTMPSVKHLVTLYHVLDLESIWDLLYFGGPVR